MLGCQIKLRITDEQARGGEMGCLLRFARGIEEAIQDTAIMRPAEEDSVGGEKPNPSVFHNSSAFSHCLTWKCGDGPAWQVFVFCF